ncbi:MAG: TonB family protein [Lentisphaeria bacterium]|nr:TonB family protein [Lentisphaeria bacterium]
MSAAGAAGAAVRREVIVYVRPLPGWLWRVVLGGCALGLTAVTALVLPLSDLLAPKAQSEVTYRTVEVTTWQPPLPKPPPPPPRRPPPPPERPPEATEVQPRLEHPPEAPRTRPKLPLRIDLALSPFATDLSLDFDVDAQAEVLPEVIEPTPPPPPPPAADPAPAPREPDHPPRVISQIKPLYPYLARTRRIEGYVDLQFTVTASGEVEDARVMATEPPRVFDRAALEAVQEWRFAPATRQGSPAPARLQIRIRFELDDKP